MANPSLTPQERESGIIWNEADKDVEVAVYTPRWVKHLEGKLGLTPFEVDETGGGCRFYRMPKSWLRLPQRPKHLSKAHKDKVIKALEKARSQTKQGAKTLSPDSAKGTKTRASRQGPSPNPPHLGSHRDKPASPSK